MAVSDAFRDYVVEQVAGLGAVTVRRMFGGAGLYHDGLFFGMLDDDEVFFRVDDATRPRYEARGARPFAPMANEAPMRGYYQVPPEILEDREVLVAWASDAVTAARTAKAPQRTRKGRRR